MAFVYSGDKQENCSLRKKRTLFINRRKRP